MANSTLSNDGTPSSLRPLLSDGPDRTAAKHLSLAGGMCGAVFLIPLDSYRVDSEAGDFPALPTSCVTCTQETTITGLVFEEGSEWRDADGEPITSITLPTGTFFLPATSFVVSSGSMVAYLSGPWTPAV